MNNAMKKLLCLVLVLCMIFSCAVILAACGKDDDKEPTKKPDEDPCADGHNYVDGVCSVCGKEKGDDEQDKLTLDFIAPTRPADALLPEAKIGDYTYRGATTALGTNWNPHTWETNADDSILAYLSSPFVTMEALDTEEGLYQWVGEMATEIHDITAANQDKLIKYGVTIPDGTKIEDIKSGYVFEIKLNPNAKWQDGSAIDASDYVYSMKQLLNPDMKNYRANLYISGESALAGAFNYYYSKDAGFYNGYTTKHADLEAAVAAGEELFINVWGFWGAKGYTDADGNLCPEWINVNDETVYGQELGVGDAFSAKALFDAYYAYLNAGGGYEAYVGIYVLNENVGASYDGVGLYVVDDYTIVYVCQTAIEFNYFLTSCTSTWLVHEGLYEDLKKEEGGAVITTYGTSVETTMSYGTWKLATFEDDKQMIFVRNENWYGWEKDANGNLVSYTQFQVDGKYLQQYITTQIVYDVMTTDVMKQKFMKGEIDSWSPDASELKEYNFSKRLQVVDETYTMSFFFHTNLDNLKALDDKGTNTNSVVLTNDNFRKAMSLAIDRADFVTATQAWTPAFSLMNHLYHYDIYNDPSSSYRKSEEAMQAICNLYGVTYGGEDDLFDNLKDAHDAITGYNLTDAKALMKKACEELVAAGLYTKGENIKIQIGWAKGASTPDDEAQCALINKYVNAALEGSGFGTIEFVPVFNITDRYGDTADGLYAIGYGAWGGAAFYPFRNLQVYTDPDQYGINEAGCWDPTTETLTLTWTDDKGNEVTDTLTWQEWGNALVGTGKYAGASNKVKLAITAMLEEKFLAKFYRIPLAITTVCSLNSYKIEDYTDEYNIMYGFGGFRIMDYNYSDSEWAAYVESQGGTLNYK